MDERYSVVSAVVVNHDTKDMLARCLQSLREQEYPGQLRIVVVDNDSRDGSREMVLGEFDEVNLIQNLSNVGYGRACNQGIEASCGDYVFIMNSDIELSPDAITAAVDFFDSSPDAGAVGLRLVNPDGSLQLSCREFPDIFEAARHGFLGLLRPDHPATRKYRMADWEHDEVVEVDWVSGALIAARREALEQVGNFDEGFFMYVEDVDLCRRLWDSDWKVYYLPRSEVVHHVAQSSSMVSTRMILAHHMSMYRYQRKHYRGGARPLVNLGVLLGVMARAALVLCLNVWAKIRSARGKEGKTIMPGRQ